MASKNTIKNYVDRKTVTEVKIFYSDGSYHRFIKDDEQNFSQYIGLS